VLAESPHKPSSAGLSPQTLHSAVILEQLYSEGFDPELAEQQVREACEQSRLRDVRNLHRYRSFGQFGWTEDDRGSVPERMVQR
jgi:hypothetical protein